MATVVAYLAFFISKINAHSWARCTHYKAEITGGDYSEDQCEGWIRGWSFDSVDFGQDRGVNYQVGVGGGQDLCQRTITGTSDDGYSGSYANSDKLASYTAGSTVRVVWPAKNHANYECFNNIPDASMKLYMNPNPNPTGDISNTQSTMGDQGYILVKDWQESCTAGSDGCGFQNCPRFCDNTDRATCYGDFVVPSVATSGYYTFVWYWIFNPGAPYTSCWEAYIDAQPAQDTVITSDDFAESSAKDPGTVKGYLTQMPVCITGQQYVADTIEAFVYQQFSAVVEKTDISIISVSEGTNGYNLTAQISHSTPGQGITDVADNYFCDNFVSIYGSSTTCDNCRDTITFALFSSGNSQNVIVSSLISLFLVILFV